VLTSGRQDYGILRSTILLLRAQPEFTTLVWAGGTHLQSRFGEPLTLLRRDGVTPSRTLDFVAEPPEPAGDAARALVAVAAALAADQPDALLLMGDRSETLAAGVAAAVAGVPIVHLHGGEETEGAIDNACRHALTKLSHLHLVSHPTHAARVVQMGEDPDTVIVVGAPGLDNRYREDLPDRQELERSLGASLEPPVVLVTMHPTTLGEPPDEELGAVAAAMAEVPATYVITAPNADAGGAAIREFWRRWASGRSRVVLVETLGETRYWGMLRLGDAVLGNSSSGIIEAPVAGIPVVNVGDRQKGRLRVGTVTDVAPRADAVAEALRAALTTGRATVNAGRGYPEGPAAPRILDALRRWDAPHPPRKAFREVPCRD
jgi:UDP-N-acetylglucosamine 2-epimerase (non-hydrolysing)/GDP/UDP-N,N'-diacetylbacillosamine 2-epimerase (hydrolysing)